MAKLEQRPTIELEVVLRLKEAEVRALEALACYGTDAFLRVFYDKLGQAYLRPHEAGLRSLFKDITEHLPAITDRANDARKAFVQGLKPDIRAA